MNLNKVILVGRLTRDPEVKALPSGQQIAKFGLATSRIFNDKNGQRQELTEFHNITFFGKIADTASQYLRKGSLTLIEGRLQTSSWEDQQGVKKYRTEIIGEGLQLGPKSTNPSQESSNSKQKEEEIPTIQEDEDEEEIDVKDIPF